MIIWLLACNDPVESTKVVKDGIDLTDVEAPWLGTGTQTDVNVDLEALTQALERAVLKVTQLDPSPLFDINDEGLAEADANCPQFFTSPEGLDYWLDSCVSDNGAAYEGYGIVDVQPKVRIDDGVVGTTATIGGVGSVVHSDGSSWSYNGFVQATRGGNAQGTFFISSTTVSGTFEVDHASAIDTWLDEGIAPELNIVRYDIANTGGVSAVGGVLAGLGQPYSTVVFQDTTIGDSLTNFSDCGLEPTGAISVQLPGGQWADVLFDPVNTGEGIRTEPGACDGCGAAWVLTESLGSVCVDFSSWLPFFVPSTTTTTTTATTTTDTGPDSTTDTGLTTSDTGL